MKKMILGILVLTLVGCATANEEEKSATSLIDDITISLPDNDTTILVEHDEVIESKIDESKKLARYLYSPDLYNYNQNIITIISNPDSVYVMGNKWNQFPASFVPKNLVVPNVEFSFTGEDQKKQMVDVAALALENLFVLAKEDDYSLVAVSGYRSYKRQESVYKHWVNLYGVEEADKFSAKPGHSEHQTGLTMDVSCSALNFRLEYELGDLDEGKWLKDNAHKAGFIIRYPEDKTDITGYNYEPWHLRYIGELAYYLYENELTLEEYYFSLIN